MIYDAIFLGGGLSSLIGGYELGLKSGNFKILNGGKHWGGYFGHFNIFSQKRSLAMCLLEFSSYSKKQTSDFSKYDPESKNSSADFVLEILNYLKLKNFDPIKALAPETCFNGNFYEDFFITDSLKILNDKIFSGNLSFKTKPNIKDLHPSGKFKTIQEEKVSLEDFSLANNGKAITDNLINPFVRKLTNRPLADFAGFLNRVLWVPIYYPETLDCFLKSGESNISEVDFSTVAGNRIFEISNFFENELKTSLVENVEIHEIIKKSKAWEVVTNKETYLTKTLYSGVDNDLLLKKLKRNFKSYEKASLKLNYYSFPKTYLNKGFSTIFFPDLRNSFFRCTNLGEADNSEEVCLVLESNFDFSSERKEDLFESLKSLGIVKNDTMVLKSEEKILKNSFLLPTFENLERFQYNKNEVLKGLPGVYLGCSNQGFCNSSFNDQVCDGLKFSNSLEWL